MTTTYQASAFPNPTPVPLKTCLPSYCYWQFSDDDNLQAFVASFNTLAQSYLSWFNSTPLAVYTGSGIYGPLLDWIGNGIYGIPRPVLSSFSSLTIAGYDEYAYNTMAYNGLSYSASGTSSIATDDIYKRVLTWTLYRGDGQQFCIPWLKRRVSRFLYGVNGMDVPGILDNPPSVSVASSTYTITVPAGASSTIFSQCVADGILPLPFQYTFDVVVLC